MSYGLCAKECKYNDGCLCVKPKDIKILCEKEFNKSLKQTTYNLKVGK
jgi:hypothetical protein